MMNEYKPDRWLVIKIQNHDYRVLAGWFGGYLDSDRFRLSSGIISTKEDGEFILFKNHSGSVYRCHKSAHGSTMLTYSIYNELINMYDDVELMPSDWKIW